MNLNPEWLDNTLTALLEARSSLHHALLLTGPEGIGKEWLARQVAGAFLCEQTQDGKRACGICNACRWVASNSHPDLRVIRPAADEPDSTDGERAPSSRAAKPSRDIRIEQIRALAGFVETAGHRGGTKVILVTPADAMNSAAANALLKTLEEPSGRTRFLLVSSRPERLAATVRSRCRHVPVPMPDLSISRDWVVRATGASPAKVDAWLAYCAGAPLRAASLAQGQGAESLSAIIDVIAQLPGEPLGAAESLADCEARDWVTALHAWCIDLGRCAAGAPPVRFPQQRERLAALAERVHPSALWQLDAWLTDLSKVVSHPLNARLMAEDALIRYQGLFSDRPA
jgi:DNA polymerase-3 subunit delta'